jgi:hypothetical protein
MASSDHLRLVLIDWVDSHALSREVWMTLDGSWNTAPRVIHSVGWLMHDGPDTKIVVPHRNEEPPNHYAQGSGAIAIPTRAVLRITDLIRGRTRRM